MKQYRIPLRVVLFKEEGLWFAHSLEFDVVGDGEDPKGAVERLVDAIDLQFEMTAVHDNVENLFVPAEGKYFEMFARGQDVAVVGLDLKIGENRMWPNFEIQSIAVREKSEADLVPA